MPQFIAPTKPIEHFDSDRDVLDFPRGGIFGSPDHQPAKGSSALSLAHELEAQLDSMQAQLDDLADQVDNAFTFPAPSCDDTWQAPAA